MIVVTIKAILKSKGNSVYSISPSDSILDALNLMAEKNVGAVLVIEEGRVEGVFSERDYARYVILQNRSEDTLVGEVMTQDIYFVSPLHSVEESLAQMTDKHIRHLPVIDEDKVVGVVSIGI